MARHPKNATPTLTKKLITDLSAALRGGLYVETAAALCGISKDTFYRWMRMADETSSDLLVELSDAVKKALAESELRDLSVIDAAAQSGVWQAAAWRLERKFPARWAKKVAIPQFESPNVEPPPRDVTQMSDEELRQESRRLARKILAEEEACSESSLSKNSSSARKPGNDLGTALSKNGG